MRGPVKGGDATLLFLPRHGRGHRFPPIAINYRANICALKMLGATHVLSVSAVGSMSEEIAPGDLVVVDQFIDLTKRRVSTFFDDGIVAHVPFADPVCPILASGASTSAALGAPGARVHRAAPTSASRARSSRRAPRAASTGAGASHVIGMTNMPEAKLAREAELPYATLALSTDYDCWHVERGGGERRGGDRRAATEHRHRARTSRAASPAACPTWRRARRAARSDAAAHHDARRDGASPEATRERLALAASAAGASA